MIIQGDARHIPLADQSVQMVVTSPPYYRLRNYGIGGQIGLELTFADYRKSLLEVAREIRRVLRPDGTFWLNLGDCFGPKDLLGVPWRIAFALQEDGWFLRSDIVWHKPNCMPESVKNRPTRAHEYLFLFSKSKKYYYDADAIKMPYAESSLKRVTQDSFDAQTGGDKDYSTTGVNASRSMRKALVNFKTHVVEEAYTGQDTKDYAASGAQSPSDTKRRVLEAMRKGKGANARSVWRIPTKPFKGAHFATFPPALVEPCIKAGSRVGDVVLDPFGGSGTSVLVAESLGRVGVAIELNPAYVALANDRVAGRLTHTRTETRRPRSSTRRVQPAVEGVA